MVSMSLGLNCGPTVPAMLVFGIGNAVNQPRDLMAAADVQLVVHHVGPRHELRHDVHAVAAKDTRGPFHLIAASQGFRW